MSNECNEHASNEPSHMAPKQQLANAFCQARQARQWYQQRNVAHGGRIRSAKLHQLKSNGTLQPQQQATACLQSFTNLKATACCNRNGRIRSAKQDNLISNGRLHTDGEFVLPSFTNLKATDVATSKASDGMSAKLHNLKSNGTLQPQYGKNFSTCVLVHNLNSLAPNFGVLREHWCQRAGSGSVQPKGSCTPIAASTPRLRSTWHR